jgi:cell division protein FtsB
MPKVRASSRPASSGRTASPSSRCSRAARRRRALLLLVGLLLVVIAVLANYGPVQAYRDAKTRLDKAVTAVAELKVEKAELQSQLGKLSEADYLASLARQDLAYTRPGEELYIVTGLDEEDVQVTRSGEDAAAPVGETNGAEGTATQPTGGPGFLERVLGSLIDQF